MPRERRQTIEFLLQYGNSVVREIIFGKKKFNPLDKHFNLLTRE